MKTVRFAKLVRRCGRPVHHLTWTDPAKDRVLQGAAKKFQVLTVHQPARGAKKDHGVVGLETGRDVQYFIFPRSLRAFADAKIIAIQYDLAGEKLEVGAIPPPKKKTAMSRRPTPPPVSAKSESEPKPPPTMKDVRTDLQAALRDLKQRRTAAAAGRLAGLLADLPRE